MRTAAPDAERAPIHLSRHDFGAGLDPNPHESGRVDGIVAADSCSRGRAAEARPYALAVRAECQPVIGAYDVVAIEPAIGQRQHAMPTFVIERDWPAALQTVEYQFP